MSAASRNDMVGLQKLQDSLVEQIGEAGKLGYRGRYISAHMTILHAKGATLEDAAEELGITVCNAKGYAHRLKIRFKRRRTLQTKERHEIIRSGYAKIMPLSEIAKATGLSVRSVKTIAGNIGASRTPAGAADHRRGFAIPENLKQDYRALTRVGGYRSREAGIALGLLEAEQ